MPPIPHTNACYYMMQGISTPHARHRYAPRKASARPTQGIPTTCNYHFSLHSHSFCAFPAPHGIVARFSQAERNIFLTIEIRSSRLRNYCTLTFWLSATYTKIESLRIIFTSVSLQILSSTIVDRRKQEMFFRWSGKLFRQNRFLSRLVLHPQRRILYLPLWFVRISNV